VRIAKLLGGSRVGRAAGDSYEVTYVDQAGTRCRRSLRDVTSFPFYEVDPVRRPLAYRRQRHLSGYYWLSTTRRLVFYETRLECDRVMLLDFSGVDAIAAQPFCLHFCVGGYRGTIGHVPDYFALLDKRATVIDVTPAQFRYSPPDRAEKFALTARACQFAGWCYRIETEPDPTLLVNVRALAGFRREPADLDRFAPLLLAACAEPKTIGVLSSTIGLRPLVRPVLFHLLWKRWLVADLQTPLDEATLIGLGPRTDE
jgi:hypothetical protein